MLEYKVVEKKAKGLFGGRMKPADLQLLLNRRADGGWELDRIIDGGASMSMAKGAFYMIFKRPTDVRMG